ncbi:MAG: class I SAM-dependent RNA methyltransferase [Actinomycetota bacterium]|nr:class I SAM-dependent RNA methyltransferase [Actinomycetota bacterium]
MTELTVDTIAHGGEAVGRIDGKAHFVAGAIPGERVEIEVFKEKARWARGRLVEILESSPDRIEPPCPAYPICGGCTWQHASYERQLEWKREVVVGQLAHLGGLSDVPVRSTIAPGPPYGYRNRMDFSVLDGRPALHEHRSDQLVGLDRCPLLRPDLAKRFAALGDLRGTTKIVLRSGVNTGDALIMVEGRVPSQADGWNASVVVQSREGLRVVHGRPWFEEENNGVRFRVPANAFFQVNTAGAEELVRLVADAAAVTPNDVLLDGYAGVGLFAATIGRSAGRVVTIDAGKAAYGAITGNLEQVIPGRYRSMLGPFERIAPTAKDRWDVAVVDPPRAGLGSDGVAAVTRAGPRTIVLISCDPASLARDASLLGDSGYRVDWVQPVDLFPQTYHVETVTRFVLR